MLDNVVLKVSRRYHPPFLNYQENTRGGVMSLFSTAPVNVFPFRSSWTLAFLLKTLWHDFAKAFFIKAIFCWNFLGRTSHSCWIQVSGRHPSFLDYWECSPGRCLPTRSSQWGRTWSELALTRLSGNSKRAVSSQHLLYDFKYSSSSEWHNAKLR